MRKLFVIALFAIAQTTMAQRTPTMGWSSWNTFALNINEDLIKQQADAMHQTGLQKAGFKYVLIDFWASWCRPCRMEMPNVIQNYERFRDKGLEVLAISIDDKKDAWQRGIKSFGTPFIQLTELQGRKSRLCAIYGISNIPANLLIDPQGKIIAADLRGKALTSKLESIFK